ncbi:MBL fold metallo-hydrolase [Caryophanon tenue]|uniref:Competence protein n=1 Tax=Caryophanon tenue TaxID=33978 RepID=A0A1C0YIQ7_9BACL|nr:MBL fold metallo-hydrolase [Caryophanon tenue]OCS87033.1 competence protein [Caryophanon tenue]
MKKWWLLGTVLMSTVLAGCQLTNEPAEAGDTMRVHFLNVGQGDSILIESPTDEYMLIDGGDKGSGKEIVAYLREQGIDTLDYVVATHPDADHIGGLIDVLESVEIEQWLDSGKAHTSQTYIEMLTLIDEKEIDFTVAQTGDMVAFDEALDVEVVYADEQASDNNEASVVLKMTYGDRSFLFAGDAGIEIEKGLLSENIQADVLKAGHHGSNTSSSEAFIKKVDPEITILSYGQDNKYGHPHKEVTDILTKQQSLIYATAQSGTIIVETDGVNLSVDDADVWQSDGKATTKPIVSASGEQMVTITKKDAVSEVVTIKNTGTAPVNLSGWTLVSVQGDQRFVFDDYTLDANKSVHITSGDNRRDGGAYIHWSGRQIWANDGDEAQLLNAEGEIVHAID